MKLAEFINESPAQEFTGNFPSQALCLLCLCLIFLMPGRSVVVFVAVVFKNLVTDCFL